MRSPALASIVALLALIAAPATGSNPAFAVRAEGYIGWAKFEAEPLFDESAFQGGGSGSTAVGFDGFYLQGDVFGNATNYDDFDTDVIGGGGHLGWRSPEQGGVGAVASYNDVDVGGASLDIWRAGVEGDLFLGPVTLGLNGGYIDLDVDDGGYVTGDLAVYPIEDLRIDASGGMYNIGDGAALGLVQAGAELLVLDHFGAFARWEAFFDDSEPDDFNQQSVIFGLRLYWGADEPSLRSYDRGYLQPSCGGFLFFGRLC